MAANLLPMSAMPEDDALQDVLTRKRQLEMYILRSPDYLFRADQRLKRQMVVLGVGIVLLLIFEGCFVALEASKMPLWLLSLLCGTSALVFFNCVLVMRTKRYLHRLNESWLNPEEKQALDALREQQARIRSQG